MKQAFQCWFQSLLARSSKAGFTSSLLCLTITLFLTLPASAADTLTWRTNQNLVSADIKHGDLWKMLGQIASATGWKVYVEPGQTPAVSAKFSNLAPGEALHLLLGELNFALVPETNASPKLFVFRTALKNATRLVAPLKPSRSGEAKLLANELIVRLKPGAKIDDLARRLGAKVVGRIDGLNAYRLQFDDQAAADTAREQLASNPDVASVDSNYSIDRPSAPQGLQSATVPPAHLQLKPPPDSGRVIVGLVDTAVQPLGNNLDGFLLKAVSVAGDSQLDPNSPSHGTAMAETILRSIENITKGSSSVQILPVDVYGPNESTSTFDAAAGIVQAINGGARIINMSFASEGDSPFLHGVITEAPKNILFIGAAGNQPVTTPFYPAAYPEVLAVTAIDQGQLDSYASRGSFVSLGAPGTSVIYFNNQAYYVTGTSSSAAFTSGMAAGFMDSTHSTIDKVPAFLLSNFGVSIRPAK